MAALLISRDAFCFLALPILSRSRSAIPERARLEGGGRIDYPCWAPTFWHGMGVRVWFGLLREGKFRISPSKLGMAASISLVSVFNSIARLITERKFARQLQVCKLPEDPIFILGHWRSGTTFLHELMMLDQRFCTPSTYQCFAPGHFLSTKGFTRLRLAQWLLPSKRPGDNVKVGWGRPQEDEFALMNLGAPCPYRRIAFPSDQSATPRALDIARLPEAEKRRWTEAMRGFIARLHLNSKRRLVLKSPTHTARVAVLLELFPKARFIYITRNPYTMIASTKRLWQSLHQTQSLQKDLAVDLDNYIFCCFEEMQSAFKRDRDLLQSEQLHELRYEDLVTDPQGSLLRLYKTLHLGDFEPMRLALDATLPDIRDYRTNIYSLSTAMKQAIATACGEVFRTYHYDPDSGEPR